MPRTQAAERAAPRTDQVGTLATLTTAGLLATVGAALVLVLDDDVSPWWWTAVGFAFVFGVVALVATVAAVLRRRAAIEEGGQPTGGDAGEPATPRHAVVQPSAGVSRLSSARRGRRSTRWWQGCCDGSGTRRSGARRRPTPGRPMGPTQGLRVAARLASPQKGETA